VEVRNPVILHLRFAHVSSEGQQCWCQVLAKISSGVGQPFRLNFWHAFAVAVLHLLVIWSSCHGKVSSCTPLEEKRPGDHAFYRLFSTIL
jgi:hypothetical protein